MTKTFVVKSWIYDISYKFNNHCECKPSYCCTTQCSKCSTSTLTVRLKVTIPTFIIKYIPTQYKVIMVCNMICKTREEAMILLFATNPPLLWLHHAGKDVCSRTMQTAHTTTIVGQIDFRMKMSPNHLSTNGEEIIMVSWHGNTFGITGPLWGGLTGDRWFPLIKER